MYPSRITEVKGGGEREMLDSGEKEKSIIEIDLYQENEGKSGGNPQIIVTMECGKDTEPQPVEEKGFMLQRRSSACPPPYSSNTVPSAEDYHRFYWKCMTLKSELIRLDFALRSIAASGPGILATHDLKQSLSYLRDLYGINTAMLYPKDGNVEKFKTPNTEKYLDRFPLCFSNFGGALNATVKAFDGFNDVYHDETLTLQLYTLEKRFQTESCRLYGSEIGVALHTGDDTTKAQVQVLLKDWIEKAIDSLAKSVNQFHEKGITKINEAQRSKSSRYLDMTTIATFFSAVTASMIQTTASDVDTKAGVAANTFFFSSLVFSMASAVNSLLVVSWRRSVVHEPDGELTTNIWFKAWLGVGPMVSLIISGIFFVIGLCLSAFATKQHIITSLVTICFSGMHAVMLLTIVFLHVRGKWVFRKQSGEIGRDLTRGSIVLMIIDLLRRILGLSDHDTVQAGQIMTSGFNIAQVEEGAATSCRKSNGRRHNSLHRLLQRCEQNTRESNALSDEVFVLSFSYDPSRNHQSYQERQQSLLSTSKPVDPELRSQSSKRSLKNRRMSNASFAEANINRQDSKIRRRTSSVKTRTRKESIIGHKSKDFLGGIGKIMESRSEENSEEEMEIEQHDKLEVKQVAEHRRVAYDHDPDVAAIYTAQSVELERSSSMHSSGSQRHSVTSCSSDKAVDRLRRRRCHRYQTRNSDSGSNDDLEPNFSSSSEDNGLNELVELAAALRHAIRDREREKSYVHDAARFLPSHGH